MQSTRSGGGVSGGQPGGKWRGRGGRRQRAGGSGDRPEQNVRLSKKLSSILRHRARENGLTVRPDGFVVVEDLLQTPGFKGVTVEEILQVVESNDKQRFAVVQTEEGLIIRANQGHTMAGIEEHLLLRQLDLDSCPDTVVHGAYANAWNSIKAGGLHRMSRTHVHMAKGLPGDGGVISGMRSSAHIAIYIDAKRAISDGLEFFESDNGVVLCQHVPAEYFSQVLDLRSGKTLTLSS